MRRRCSICPPLLILALLFGFASPALADAEIDDAYRTAVARLLAAQNTPESVNQQLTYSVAQQTLALLANNGVEITEPIQQIVFEASSESIGKRLSEVGTLANLYAPIYAQHYDKKELLELIAFWESPVGKKTIEVMPQMTERSFVALQEAGTPFLAGFYQTVDDRLNEAGIVLAPSALPDTTPPPE